MSEATETSKQPIRTRYLSHVTGYQPIRDEYTGQFRIKVRRNQQVFVGDTVNIYGTVVLTYNSDDICERISFKQGPSEKDVGLTTCAYKGFYKNTTIAEIEGRHRYYIQHSYIASTLDWDVFILTFSKDGFVVNDPQKSYVYTYATNTKWQKAFCACDKDVKMCADKGGSSPQGCPISINYKQQNIFLRVLWQTPGNTYGISFYDESMTSLVDIAISWQSDDTMVVGYQTNTRSRVVTYETVATTTTSEMKATVLVTFTRARLVLYHKLHSLTCLARPSFRVLHPQMQRRVRTHTNRPNQEILVPDWLITSQVTKITSSDWLFNCFGRTATLTVQNTGSTDYIVDWFTPNDNTISDDSPEYGIQQSGDIITLTMADTVSDEAFKDLMESRNHSVRILQNNLKVWQSTFFPHVYRIKVRRNQQVFVGDTVNIYGTVVLTYNSDDICERISFKQGPSEKDVGLTTCEYKGFYKNTTIAEIEGRHRYYIQHSYIASTLDWDVFILTFSKDGFVGGSSPQGCPISINYKQQNIFLRVLWQTPGNTYGISFYDESMTSLVDIAISWQSDDTMVVGYQTNTRSRVVTYETVATTTTSEMKATVLVTFTRTGLILYHVEKGTQLWFTAFNGQISSVVKFGFNRFSNSNNALYQVSKTTFINLARPSFRALHPQMQRRIDRLGTDRIRKWLITSQVTKITSSDWLFNCFGRF
eukprot:sb/3462590/